MVLLVIEYCQENDVGKGAAKKKPERRDKSPLKTVNVTKKPSLHSHLSVTALGYSGEGKR